MNIRQLETFYWIAKLGTFNAAAERLHTSQANVSARIRELEQDLAIVLFDRIGRHVQVTIKGRELLVHAEKVIVEAARLRLAAGKPDLELGALRIGVGEVIAAQSLVALINELKVRFPGLDVEFDIDLNAGLLRKLLRGVVDVAVIGGPVDEPEIEQRPIGALNLVWVGTPALIGIRSTVTPDDLALLPVITLGRDSLISAKMRAWFANAGVVPTVVNYCNNLSTMLQVARAGVCICIVPETLVTRDIENSALVAPAAVPAIPPMTFFVATRVDTLDPATADVARIVADVTRLASIPAPEVAERSPDFGGAKFAAADASSRGRRTRLQ
jgi:DNA-binding transcriptional LysR family regulator